MHYKCRLWFLRVAANHDFNTWVSISGFNYEHHSWSKVILAVLVEGNSRMCCGSKGMFSHFSVLNFWVDFIFLFHLLDHLNFWGLPHSCGRLYFLVGLHFLGHSYFGVVSIFCFCFLFLGCLPFWGPGHTGPNRAKWSQT